MDFLFKSPESQLYGLTIFLAIIAFQIAFVFVQWMFKKRADYLFYIAYMTTTGLFGLSLYKNILDFSPFSRIPDKWFDYGNYMLSLLAILLYYRFARSFVSLAEKRPKLNKQVKMLESWLLGYLAISVLFILNMLPQNHWENLFAFTAGITIIVSAYIIGRFLKESSVLEKYAMLAASFLVLGSIFDLTLVTLGKNGYWIPCDPHLPLLICVFAEILTFTSGLTYKTKLLETNQLSISNEVLTRQKEAQRATNELLELKNNYSRDLHDDIGARLSLINITLQQYSLETSEISKDSLIIKCSALINQSISHLRKMMNEIHGPPVHHEGYVKSIETLVKSIQNVKEIRFHINFRNLTGFSNPTLEYHLYMVTQELINNTLKYAKANNVIINVSRHKKQLILIYKDDGLGFDPENCKKGNGILNIEKRVKNLNGKSIFRSRENEGFCCEIYIND